MLISATRLAAIRRQPRRHCRHCATAAAAAAAATHTLTGPCCRLTQWWQPIPGLPIVPVNVFLVREGSRWALVDAGLAGSRWQPHAEQLLAALRAAIPANETLSAILCEEGAYSQPG